MTIFRNIKRQGFTLAEIMVSVAIIAIFSSMSIALFYSYRKTGELNMAAYKLISDIRKAQEYALGLKELNPTDGFPLGGWGVFFDKSNPAKNKYTIFADLDNDKIMDAGESSSEIYIQSNIVIQNINMDEAVMPGNRVYATFLPPDPTVSLCRNGSLCATTNIEIKLSQDGTSVVGVKINKNGLAEIINY